MPSFEINIAILVNKAVLDSLKIPTLGLIIDNVELVIVLPDPIRISVIINNTFFLFKHLYLFYNIRYLL